MYKAKDFSKYEAFSSLQEIEKIACELIQYHNDKAHFGGFRDYGHMGQCRFLSSTGEGRGDMYVAYQAGKGNTHFHAELTLGRDLMLKVSKYQVVDTILHEIAHSIAGLEARNSGKFMAHGKAWRRVAAQIGATPRAKSDLSKDRVFCKQRDSQPVTEQLGSWNLVLEMPGTSPRLVRVYKKRPKPNTFRTIDQCYLKSVPGSLGHLKIVPEETAKQILA